ncbi:L,D-transpeptidase family protein [Planktosalinus lacus]|uniref:Murein L,D-transpeptidase n=1 Tax=Planktosalinus lacus TaxID=1526573 RepID=A0A8J2V924_9FLAO|nr:L,D-transpeptidase family protein [Planktosalinus lacus]GGD87877.1 murein L,D-transpeptidase [Planktosalinus lacus]
MIKKYLIVLIAISISLFACKDGIKVETMPEKTFEEIKLKIPKENKIKQHSMDSTSFAVIKDSIILSFYQKNNLKTFWVSDVVRGNLLQTLYNLEDEGLFKSHFPLDSIDKQEQNITNLSDNDLVNYDILLTETLLKYLIKVSRGSIQPNKFYNDYTLNENSFDYLTVLKKLQNEDFEAAIASIKPQHLVYKQLKEALKLIDEFKINSFPRIDIEDKIRLGDSLEEVAVIKERLIFWKDLSPKDSLTLLFDEETELAVQKFQMRHGLAPDGVVGAGTLSALNITPAERKQQIIANMERWRWYPRSFGDEYIILNIPDYSMQVVRNNDTTRSHKVIVGKASRKTPVLNSKLTHLVFNPTWTIPPTIKKNDIIPATAKNRSYLTDKNITVYDRSGAVIKPEDWNQRDAVSYRYVQSPGNYNSLGLVKFMFPNKYAVYLHDTNSRSFFERATRSLSSGCVRVQNPFELSAYLLDDEEKWSLEKILNLVKTNKTTEARMNRDVQVHLLYWSAWSENGNLKFRDDLYEKDFKLYEALSNQL